MAVDQLCKDQRRLQVYVEVPSRRSLVTEREPGSDTSSDINMTTTNPPSYKRKLSQPEMDPSVDLKKQKLAESNINTLPSKTVTEPPPRKRKLSQPDAAAPIELKKQKFTETKTNAIPSKSTTEGKDTVKEKDASGDDLKPTKTTQKKVKASTSTSPGNAVVISATNPSEEFPNGHLYCHQCNKKRDASQVISCTEVAKKCRTKYCKPCLGNRYGEDIDEIKQTPASGRGKTKMPYTFRCPRCRGICNCRTCRRAQGLEPTGNLTNAARKVGISAAALLHVNPAQKGILPGQGQERKRAKAAASAAVSSKQTTPPGASTSKPVVKPQAKPKPAKPLIPVIQPTWTRLSTIPQEITVEHLEERMFIREFMIRFSSLMDKEVKMHLDELGEIVGDGSVDWVVSEALPRKGQKPSDIPLVSWVSEKCVRSIVSGLLGIYVEDATGSLKKGLQSTLKEIKSNSANMTKIWATLASLRNAHPNDFAFPDPLPPPTTMPVYNTRSGALNQDGTPVGHSAQLVHVVLDLIEGLMTGGSKFLKAEIDKGINEAKDIAKRGKEAVVRENERWAKEKVRLGTTKPARPYRDAHKIRLDDLEKAQHTLISCFTSRFSSLGRDDEGREYFAFSPSVMEKEAASDIISDDLEAVGTAPKKSNGAGRGRRTAFVSGGVGAMDESKREELWNWDWFVAVWGRRPEGAVVAPDPHRDEDDGDTTDDDEGDEDEGEHGGRKRWWAFWRPEDVRNLSRWIAHRHGLDHEDDDHGLREREKVVPRATHNKASNGLLVPPVGPSTAASSTVDTFSDRASTMDPDHETDDARGEGSPLTDFEDSGDESDLPPPNWKPSQRAVKELVSSLSGYAQLLEWRVQRGERERKARQKD